MWVRGLKYPSTIYPCYNLLSHPMWVRGLKFMPNLKLLNWQDVAPYVGAWIEIAISLARSIGLSMSHPMWVRGLKLD